MKKRFLVGLIVGLFLFGITSITNATIIQSNDGLAAPSLTITFDEFGIADGTSITDQYSSLGVEFSPNLYQNSQGGSGFTNIDDYNLGNFNSDVVNPFSIEFATDQVEAAFVFITNTGTSTFSTYLNNSLMETVSFATSINTPNWYVFSGYSFDSIEVQVGGFNNCMLLDNLQLGSNTSVPEPATMLLFGSGLVGLVGLRRRKSKK